VERWRLVAGCAASCRARSHRVLPDEVLGNRSVHCRTDEYQVLAHRAGREAARELLLLPAGSDPGREARKRDRPQVALHMLEIGLVARARCRRDLVAAGSAGRRRPRTPRRAGCAGPRRPRAAAWRRGAWPRPRCRRCGRRAGACRTRRGPIQPSPATCLPVCECPSSSLSIVAGGDGRQKSGQQAKVRRGRSHEKYLQKEWCPQRNSNPCRRLERPKVPAK
jgi:hypothetical protein